MTDDADIWADRLRNRKYVEQEPDSFISDWVKRLAQKGLHALDVGCGWGRHLRLLCQAGIETVGLDTSPGMLAAAKSNLDSQGLEAELILADAQHIPFPAESFELVLCTRTIHHGDRRFIIRSLNEIERVITQGGHLLASFPSVNDWRYGNGIAIEPGTFVPDLNDEEGGIPHHYANADELLGWLKAYDIVGWDEYFEDYKPYAKPRGEYAGPDAIRDVSFDAGDTDADTGNRRWATYFVAARKKSADDNAPQDTL